jgi:hypothetical protein
MRAASTETGGKPHGKLAGLKESRQHDSFNRSGFLIPSNFFLDIKHVVPVKGTTCNNRRFLSPTGSFHSIIIKGAFCGAKQEIRKLQTANINPSFLM